MAQDFSMEAKTITGVMFQILRKNFQPIIADLAKLSSVRLLGKYF